MTHPLPERDPDNFDAASPSSQDARIVRFEREDWTRLRTVQGLQQRAGVPAHLLRRLVLKELADNALDEGAVRVGSVGGGYFVEDDGPGFDGTPEDIARMFSINRPLVSTKLWRLPTRGAQGNGLRVVAGSVIASNGSLAVTTRGKRIELRPEHDGATSVVSVEPVANQAGTRVAIRFGPAIPEDALALSWAHVAMLMNRGEVYRGKSSPFWYGPDDFHALMRASDATVREMVLELEGCARNASEIVAEAGLARVACRDITRAQADTLLTVARRYAREVKPKRLGAVGAEVFDDHAYATASGKATFGIAPLQAAIPFTVEAWVESSPAMSITACVNRSPASADILADHNQREINLFGCGLRDNIATVPRGKHFAIYLNITSPFMPTTSDSKEPDLAPFLDAIKDAVSKAIRKSRNPNATGTSQKDVVLANLDDVIALVSGDEGYRFNARQLFYALRPIVMEETGEELKISNFTGILTEYEAEHGEIPLMYREPRGSITHPHRAETITLGTLMVEKYERPAWNFHRLLYIEKEGALEALKQNRWAERHDCAVMSSKGFSTRAARDLIDKLVEHDEPVEVFCVHDADASGSMIYQTLQEATRAREARSIKIVNLGLEPWEAVEMGLEVETVEAGRQRKPVADYIAAHGRGWAEWLQTHRVELNAMTTPQLIAWLDQKMAGHGKLIPPTDVLEQELEKRIERKVRDAITERILREADLDGQVAAAIAKIETPSGKRLRQDTANLFKRRPDSEWRDHIEAVASDRAQEEDRDVIRE